MTTTKGCKVDETKPIFINGTLKQWRISERYGEVVAIGNIYGDTKSRFVDGMNIYTSQIINGPTALGYIETENSVYYLDPAEALLSMDTFEEPLDDNF